LTSIRFEEVSKAFAEVPVLQNFHMEVPGGGLAVILGGSGSGKSTIVKMIIGLVQPDSGRIFVEDTDITRLSEERLMSIRSRVGFVFQAGALFDSLTVGENVAYRLREADGCSEEEIRETVARMLGYVGLEGTQDKMPDELSGGMRRRVAIARALVGDPQIMLYDEPTAGLDPITGRTICELVIQLRDFQNVTSVLVTHDLNTAKTVASEKAVLTPAGETEFHPVESSEESATRFIILKDGKVFWEGLFEELVTSDNEYIREFLD